MFPAYAENISGPLWGQRVRALNESSRPPEQGAAERARDAAIGCETDRFIHKRQMFGAKPFSGRSGAPLTRPEANRHAPPRQGGSRVQPLWVAGVDGCRGGWFAVLVRLGSGSAPPSEARLALCSSFSELVSFIRKTRPHRGGHPDWLARSSGARRPHV